MKLFLTVSGDRPVADAWPGLRAAVAALCGSVSFELQIDGPGESALSVAGGPAGCFVLVNRVDNAQFQLTRDGAGTSTGTVIAGGIATEIEARYLVSPDVALAAVDHFVRTGDLHPELPWYEF